MDTTKGVTYTNIRGTPQPIVTHAIYHQPYTVFLAPKRLGITYASAHIAHPSARIAYRIDMTQYDIGLNTQTTPRQGFTLSDSWMCNTTRNPFNRAYIKKLPPPESTFPDERPHILGTPRPYRTLFCCFWDWTYSPARHTPLRHQPHDTRRLDISPHRHKPSRHKSHRHQPHDTSRFRHQPTSIA